MVHSSVLTALDKKKVSWFHFQAIIIAGVGFFNDAYDLFVIGLLTKLIGRIYFIPSQPPFPKKVPTIPIGPNSAVTAVALVGTFCGQLFFGWLGDAIGRKTAYGVTLLIMVVFGAAQGLSFGNTAEAVVTTLCIMRFFLGFGIGGDYPLSAVIMSEYSNRRTRGAFVAAVFSMQGIGIITGAAITLAVAGSFKSNHPRPPYSVEPIASQGYPASDFVWRIILSVGCIPAILTFYYRLKLPETARYTSIVARNAAKTAVDMSKVLKTQFTEADARIQRDADRIDASVAAAAAAAVPNGPLDFNGDHGHAVESKKEGWWKRMRRRQKQAWADFKRGWRSPKIVPFDEQNWGWFLRHYGRYLFGTSSTWFFLDIAFYSQNLFQTQVFTVIGWLPPATTMSALQETYKLARAQALVALWSTIPGYYFTVATVDWLGRKTVQLMGFFFMTLFMLILAADYPSISKKKGAFVALYSLTFFFANWGPNATTFIIPSEIFPAKFRSTGHGISAACGKAGAIVGAFGFLYASQPKSAAAAYPYPPGIGLQLTLAILTIANGLGLICTIFFVPETKGRSLEEFETPGVVGARHVELAQSTAPRGAATAVDTEAPPPPGLHVAPPAASARVAV
ncbi:phosphate transporter [Klebsormidium nitens]|uniref:Phosphate transporter n=1 Tax=Klebsormidium nitens TaxID=105231 RepID=A0A1Y1HKX1_KLENI|nr:phosphate transporter [Klebsormidium nitens]|eukprot:GAQ78613.1 phosphate transporter [Klebsormidium nitens]